jgi:hypothetical protein
VLGGRLEAQEDARERLVGLVVQVAGDARALGLPRLEDRARGARALHLEALEHPVVGLAQPRDLLHLAGRRGHRGAARGEVDRLHRGDELLERREPAAQDEAVGEHGGEDGDDEQAEAPAVRDRVGVEVHGDGRREHGRGESGAR